MTKPNLAKFFKHVRAVAVKHSPEILTGIGVAGMISTTVLAVRATPKALQLIEDYEYEHERTLKPVEVVKVAWKPYIPAAVTGIASTVCLIGATSVSTRRTAALAAAYQLSETALSEYREKVTEVIGEKKEQIVREKVNEKQIEKTPVTVTEVISTGKGHTLCFDPLSSRYFESDIEVLRRAENMVNKDLLHGIGGWVSINSFYDEIGLPNTDLGDYMGWTSDNLVSLHITSHVSDDGRPAIVVGHYNPPKYDLY